MFTKQSFNCLLILLSICPLEKSKKIISLLIFFGEKSKSKKSDLMQNLENLKLYKLPIECPFKNMHVCAKSDFTSGRLFVQ